MFVDCGILQPLGDLLIAPFVDGTGLYVAQWKRAKAFGEMLGIGQAIIGASFLGGKRIWQIVLEEKFIHRYRNCAVFKLLPPKHP